MIPSSRPQHLKCHTGPGTAGTNSISNAAQRFACMLAATLFAPQLQRYSRLHSYQAGFSAPFHKVGCFMLWQKTAMRKSMQQCSARPPPDGKNVRQWDARSTSCPGHDAPKREMAFPSIKVASACTASPGSSLQCAEPSQTIIACLSRTHSTWWPHPHYNIGRHQLVSAGMLGATSHGFTLLPWPAANALKLHTVQLMQRLLLSI